jgi:hypothetical protein
VCAVRFGAECDTVYLLLWQVERLERCYVLGCGIATLPFPLFYTSRIAFPSEVKHECILLLAIFVGIWRWGIYDDCFIQREKKRKGEMDIEIAFEEG